MKPFSRGDYSFALIIVVVAIKLAQAAYSNTSVDDWKDKSIILGSSGELLKRLITNDDPNLIDVIEELFKLDIRIIEFPTVLKNLFRTACKSPLRRPCIVIQQAYRTHSFMREIHEVVMDVTNEKYFDEEAKELCPVSWSEVDAIIPEGLWGKFVSDSEIQPSPLEKLISTRELLFQNHWINYGKLGLLNEDNLIEDYKNVLEYSNFAMNRSDQSKDQTKSDLSSSKILSRQSSPVTIQRDSPKAEKLNTLFSSSQNSSDGSSFGSISIDTLNRSSPKLGNMFYKGSNGSICKYDYLSSLIFKGGGASHTAMPDGKLQTNIMRSQASDSATVNNHHAFICDDKIFLLCAIDAGGDGRNSMPDRYEGAIKVVTEYIKSTLQVLGNVLSTLKQNSRYNHSKMADYFQQSFLYMNQWLDISLGQMGRINFSFGLIVDETVWIGSYGPHSIIGLRTTLTTQRSSSLPSRRSSQFLKLSPVVLFKSQCNEYYKQEERGFAIGATFFSKLTIKEFKLKHDDHIVMSTEELRLSDDDIHTILRDPINDIGSGRAANQIQERNSASLNGFSYHVGDFTALTIKISTCQ